MVADRRLVSGQSVFDSLLFEYGSKERTAGKSEGYYLSAIYGCDSTSNLRM